MLGTRSISIGAMALAAVLSYGAPAEAQLGGIVHDPLALIQSTANGATAIKNLEQTTTLVEHDISHLQNEAANLQAAPSALRGRLHQDLRRLGSVMDQADGVRFEDQGYASKFSEKFPTYKPGADFSKAYAAWSNNTRTAALASLRAAGIDASDNSSMAQNMDALAARSDGASGALSAAQVGNNISLQMSEQLAKLRMLQQAQIQSESAFYISQSSTSAGAVRAADGADLDAWLARSKGFHTGQIRSRSVTP